MSSSSGRIKCLIFNYLFEFILLIFFIFRNQNKKKYGKVVVVSKCFPTPPTTEKKQVLEKKTKSSKKEPTFSMHSWWHCSIRIDAFDCSEYNPLLAAVNPNIVKITPQTNARVSIENTIFRL